MFFDITIIYKNNDNDIIRKYSYQCLHTNLLPG